MVMVPSYRAAVTRVASKTPANMSTIDGANFYS